MDFALRLDQPDLGQPAASRRMAFGLLQAPAISILNGVGTDFEGGADEPALSLKWMPRGVADYHSEGRSYRLDGSSQLLLNRGQPYRMRVRGESFVLFFPEEAADAAWQVHAKDAGGMPEAPSVAARAPAALQGKLARLRDASRQTHPDGAALLERSLALLNDIVALADMRRRHAARLPVVRKTTRDELFRRLVRAEAYLADVGARATLSGAADAAALSPFHLIRVFESVFGMTPLAYAAAKRLDHAHALLIKTTAPIADIASAAGYENRNAFDRAFARRFGRTPGAVRNAR